MTKIFFTLKFLTRLICIVSFIACFYHAISSIPAILQSTTLISLQKSEVILRIAQQVCLIVIALFIAFKAKEAKGRYLFALFIVFSVHNDWWIYEVIPNRWIGYFLYKLEYVLTALLFISTMKYFPEVIIKAEIKDAIKARLLTSYLNWLLKPINLWLYFMIPVFLLSILADYFYLFIVLVNLVLMFTGLCYMYISYKKSSLSSRNSILWLFWGMLCYVIVYIFSSFFKFFNPAGIAYLNFIINALMYFIILIMVFMSVFFADSFDTGFIITRTFVDGLLFLIVVLLYNVIEHYLLHIMNDNFEINNAFISSLLSGLMVLIISPLHHRLTHYLNNRLKHNHSEH